MTSIQTNETRTIERMMVRLEHLDKLLSLAGEVIITSSSLHELQRDMVDCAAMRTPVTESNIDTIKASDESTRRISQDLHDLVMAIRMVEVGETFRLFRRPIRDLCRNLSKTVDFQLRGENVLIDKALAERLVDPLLHILRNAVDHGIEMPIERAKNGKPEKAIVRLVAIDHENHTELIITDDGRGIDTESVMRKAREHGLIRANEKPELLDLLCKSGFSTRDSATATSGRGVGLDIVKEMVNEFDGTMTLESKVGEGTTFRLNIPKLRAVNIIDALTVRAGDQYFALAIEQVLSLQAIPKEEVRRTMDCESFITYLGEVIPLFDLRQILGGESIDINENDTVPVVIIEGKRSRIAVIVTEFLSPQKLVNVPLDVTIFTHRAGGVAGTCIFAGGRVGLTVDVDELVAMATGDGSSRFERTQQLQQQESLWDDDRDDTEIADGTEARSPGETESQDHNNDVSNRAATERAETSPGLQTTLSTGTQLEDGDILDLVEELRRSLTQLQDTLISLEDNPENTTLLNDAFRRLHAAKGNLTMIDQPDYSHLAHSMETVLDFLRSDRIMMTPDLMDVLLDGLSNLSNAAATLPDQPAPPNRKVLDQLEREIREHTAHSSILSDNELLSKTFNLCPTTELQLLGALKRGENTFESYIKFQSGRQAEYLIAYLLLRKLCSRGMVLATLPEIDAIETGQCGNSIKVLWSSSMSIEEMAQMMEQIAPLFNIIEHQSIPTTIFRYEKCDAKLG